MNLEKHPILHVSKISEDLGEYISPRSERIREFLSKKKFRVNKFDTTYRTINYWTEINLLDDDRENLKGWRTFSIVESVWLKSLIEIRKFGLSIKLMQKIKQSIFYNYREPEKRVPLLDLFITYALMGSQVYLLVYPDGEAYLATQNDIAFTEKLCNRLESHLRISINEILEEVYPPIKDHVNSKSLNLQLRDDESSFLKHLRASSFDSINLRMKDNKIDLVEGEKILKVDADQIPQLYKEHPFQKIEIVRANNKTLHIKQKIQKKLDTARDDPGSNKKRRTTA